MEHLRAAVCAPGICVLDFTDPNLGETAAFEDVAKTIQEATPPERTIVWLVDEPIDITIQNCPVWVMGPNDMIIKNCPRAKVHQTTPGAIRGLSADVLVASLSDNAHSMEVFVKVVAPIAMCKDTTVVLLVFDGRLMARLAEHKEVPAWKSPNRYDRLKALFDAKEPSNFTS